MATLGSRLETRTVVTWHVMNIQPIKRLALLLRSAIESTSKEERTACLARFPSGACGDASLLLGTYLEDLSIEGFEYVSAERGSKNDGTWTSHAWLEREGIIVDITSDQFVDGPGPVIVTRDSTWHGTFEVNERLPSTIRAWSGVDALAGFYERIRKQLPGS